MKQILIIILQQKVKKVMCEHTNHMRKERFSIYYFLKNYKIRLLAKFGCSTVHLQLSHLSMFGTLTTTSF